MRKAASKCNQYSKGKKIQQMQAHRRFRLLDSVYKTFKLNDYLVKKEGNG